MPKTDGMQTETLTFDSLVFVEPKWLMRSNHIYIQRLPYRFIHIDWLSATFAIIIFSYCFLHLIFSSPLSFHLQNNTIQCFSTVTSARIYEMRDETRKAVRWAENIERAAAGPIPPTPPPTPTPTNQASHFLLTVTSVKKKCTTFAFACTEEVSKFLVYKHSLLSLGCSSKF